MTLKAKYRGTGIIGSTSADFTSYAQNSGQFY